MTLEWVHPGLLLILGAWLLPFLKGPAKRVAMLVLPAAALVDCLLMSPGTYGTVTFLGQDLVLGRVDGLSLVFSYIFSLMALVGMVYALHVRGHDECTHALALFAGLGIDDQLVCHHGEHPGHRT